MIDELVLRNVALIREASMTPSRGFTVLTGESGSGKSAFLSGLKLLVGSRASADMVRDGASSLEVEGRFYPLQRDDPEEELIAARTIGADGRSRVRLNGSMASVRDLADAVGSGIDLCGQHENQHLLKATMQRRMLDAWVGEDLAPVRAAYQSAFRAAADAQAHYKELLEAGRLDEARLDEARFILGRIDAVSPAVGEYEELIAEARRLEHIEEIARGAGGAREALSGEAGVLDALNQALALLNGAVAAEPRLANEIKALGEANYLVEDVVRSLDSLIPDLDAYDPAQLEETQTRIASLQALMRAYGPEMEDVIARRESCAKAIALVDNRDEALAQAAQESEQAEAALAEAADALSALRAQYAPRFADEVNALLARLEMGQSSLACDIRRLDRAHWTLEGPDEVAFTFKPVPDALPRELARIASGGELSRVTLAIKVALGATDEVDTLVFDEVDAGVGGKAALAVGALLRDLAQTHQVIVVTHLPQIAVLADRHYVAERAEDNASETCLHEVEGDDRVDEVARMLSGTVDAASQAHAREMLQEASA